MAYNYIDKIMQYEPQSEQESEDKRIILEFIARYASNVLLRENKIAHITSSGFILNPALDKALMVHHNIRGVWGWTGGHADGDANLPEVAVREAMEETGVGKVSLLAPEIASVDILTVRSHYKNGRYVNAHLHLSIAYLLLCEESEKLTEKPDENSGVAWFDTAKITEPFYSEWDVYVYQKLVERARRV